MKAFWEERYGASEYAYGEEPNEFLKEQLALLPKGRVLFPADGEGRNSVYAATQGWDVVAFDMSAEGKKKANALATKFGVDVDFHVGLIQELEFPKESFDAVVLIYAHFPPEFRKVWHQRLAGYLKPGGTLIIEGFSKEHLELSKKNPKVGGPQNIDMLFSLEELQDDFNEFDLIECCGRTVDLNEGLYHVGTSSVIRLVARKR
jgi:cyclopropane fatty-acyl-phospholipid synthase-like methyltransferase